MIIKEYDMSVYEQRRIPSPGLCIYCCSELPPAKLTDEHVIPFALGHNTLILEKGSCRNCADIIQRYEQEVLKKQLGDFRLKVDAPSRKKRSERRTTIKIPFSEVDDSGEVVRDLGERTFSVEDAPVILNLWELPEALILSSDSAPFRDFGRPWSYADQRAVEINRKVAEETGSTNVAMKLGVVNRVHFSRFLARTAHAYAAAELGIDGFDPLLLDIVLNRDDDVSMYVGGTASVEGPASDPESTLLVSIGGLDDFIAVLFQFYRFLGSPAYAIVVGKRNSETQARIELMHGKYASST